MSSSDEINYGTGRLPRFPGCGPIAPAPAQPEATESGRTDPGAGTTVEQWIKGVLFGSGGLEDYERHELVVWDVPDREATAAWIIRCLANPKCEGSAEVLEAIAERRSEVQRRHARPDLKDGLGDPISARDVAILGGDPSL